MTIPTPEIDAAIAEAIKSKRQDVFGTASYERKTLLNEIDRLRKEGDLYRKDAERFQELLSRVGDDSGPTIVKIEGRSDEYPGYAWFADLSQEQVIAELDAAIAAKEKANAP